MFLGFQRCFLWHTAVSSSSEAKDLGGEKVMKLNPLFLLGIKAQKKKLGKKKDAVALWALPTPAKGAF